ncbi:MAG: tetratricopeptide repeat protein [Gemmatimonas sp.]
MLAAVVAVGVLMWADGAAAQAYQGCYVNGQRVSDSLCNGGAASSGPSMPDYSAYSGMAYAFGQALGRLLMTPPDPEPAAGPSADDIARQNAINLNNQALALVNQGRRREAIPLLQQAAAADPSNTIIVANYHHEKALLDFAAGNLDDALLEARRAVMLANDPSWRALTSDLDAIQSAVSARAADQRRRFAAGQQDLLAQLRPVHAQVATPDDAAPSASFDLQGSGVGPDHGALRSAHAADVNRRQPGNAADAKDAAPAMLQVLNQTSSYVTVSVDGGYGCNTAGGTTCAIPVSRGHHDLRAVRTDNGVSFTQRVDVSADGYIWPLRGN